MDRIGQKRPFRIYLEEWIEASGLDRKRIAERMGCSEGTLSKLISGQMRRTDQYLAAFAHAVDRDIRDLFRHPDQPTADDLLRGVSDDERDRIIRVIKAMTGTNG